MAASSACATSSSARASFASDAATGSALSVSEPSSSCAPGTVDSNAAFSTLNSARATRRSARASISSAPCKQLCCSVHAKLLCNAASRWLAQANGAGGDGGGDKHGLSKAFILIRSLTVDPLLSLGWLKLLFFRCPPI
eukprot:2888838-Prymnesium_polylepis.1